MKTIVAFVLVLVATACGKQDAELERRATTAMAELNAADETFPKQITEALTKLGSDLLFTPGSAADTVKTKILPLVDSYVATIDRAVTTADAYLATKSDDTSKQALEVIRKRGESFRKARARLAELEQKARAGASSDELNQMLMNIGLMLSIGK